MRLHVNPQSGMPLYLQIVNQVKAAIYAGVLAPEDQLLPVRSLAQQLRINPNTVARAYRELERAGVVASQQGRGTYVAAGDHQVLSVRERRLRLERILDRMLVEAHALGFAGEQVLAVLRERLEAGRTMAPSGKEADVHGGDESHE